VTAACLTLTGDTIAQVHSRIIDRRNSAAKPDSKVTSLKHFNFVFNLYPIWKLRRGLWFNAFWIKEI
jgi:hypothetical protein